MLLFLFFY